MTREGDAATARKRELMKRADLLMDSVPPRRSFTNAVIWRLAVKVKEIVWARTDPEHYRRVFGGRHA